MRVTRPSGNSAIATLAVVSAALGCGDGAVEPLPDDLIGTWNVTAIVVDEFDYTTEGMTLSFTFTSNGSYSYSVTNDLLGFCDWQVANCEEFGDFAATASQITFDPDTEWEETLNYSVTGTVLRIIGTIWDFPIDATFEKQ